MRLSTLGPRRLNLIEIDRPKSNHSSIFFLGAIPEIPPLPISSGIRRCQPARRIGWPFSARVTHDRVLYLGQHQSHNRLHAFLKSMVVSVFYDLRRIGPANHLPLYKQGYVAVARVD
jgi:hypothetical protein